MITKEETKYLFALCASAAFVLVRLAVALKLMSLQDVFTFIKHLIFSVLFIVICHHAVEIFVRMKKMYSLPGPSLRQGVRFLFNLILQSHRRGSPLPVIGNELFNCTPKLMFENTYGPVYTVLSWFVPMVMVTSAEAMKQVMHHPAAQKKSLFSFFLSLAIGDGLVTLSGDKWQAHRKLLTPAFHVKILQSVMSIVIPEARLLISKLEREASGKSDRTIDNIVPFIFDSTANILHKSAMGVETIDQVNMRTIKDGFTNVIDVLASGMFNPLLLLDCMIGFSERGRKFKEFRRAMKQFAAEMIDKRMFILKARRDENNNVTEEEMLYRRREREPFIDLMIQEHLKNPHSISLDDIHEETTTFTGAGLDTTIWSISYTLLLLGHHPEVQERLHQELKEHLSESSFDQLTPESIKRFTYLNAVYDESLRLFPPIAYIGRQADQDIAIEDAIIPKGVHIVLPISLIHRDYRNWPDPHRFKPERFLTRNPDPCTFVPFSSGARNCIGQKYANIQAKTTIICLVKKYKIQSITQLDEVVTYAGPVSHTETPIKLKLSLREPVDDNNN